VIGGPHMVVPELIGELSRGQHRRPVSRMAPDKEAKANVVRHQSVSPCLRRASTQQRIAVAKRAR
jgi:hypothetical protein